MFSKARGAYQLVSGNQERVRTHLFFSSQTEHQTSKRKRRPHNKLHQHRKDEMVQTAPGEFEPDMWSGNQRVLHFGPLAQRDPFSYCYPKDWDILYPAHFGFFPYRATKFRGSSATVCMSAFGCFFILGGAFMVYLGYFEIDWSGVFDTSNFIEPLRIAGPFMFCFGVISIVIALIISVSSQTIFGMNFRSKRSRVTVVTRYFQKPVGYYEKSPYQPLPPPAYPVLENKYVKSSVFNPQSETKLYPPVMLGCSTLSLHGRSPSYFSGNPYNTLHAVPTICKNTLLDHVPESDAQNGRANSVVTNGKHSSVSLLGTRRSKSVALPPRSEKSRHV